MKEESWFDFIHIPDNFLFFNAFKDDVLSVQTSYSMGIMGNFPGSNLAGCEANYWRF